MYVQCREMWAFANNDDIRAAIHAQPISKIGRFDECSDRIAYTHDTGSMIPIHADLVSKGMHACRAASQPLQQCVPCASLHVHSTKCLARLDITLTVSITLRQLLTVMSSVHLALLDWH